MSTPFDEFARATLGGARNVADGSPLTREQVDRVIDYLKSPGSGAIPGQSFEEWIERRMADHPPRLGAGKQYVAYSGVDQSGVSNGANARSFVAANPLSAGTIGDTPWGRFIESADAKVELNRIADGLGRQLSAEGIRPFNGSPLGAAQDMMWNAGSPEFARNAMQSGRPLIAFVDGAPVGRGFSTFELPVVREFPDGSINGHRVAALGNGAESLANARQSAVTYAHMERSVAASLGLDPDNASDLARMRSRLDLARGFDAQAGTVFGERLGALSARDLNGFGLVADEWSSRNAVLSPTAMRPGTSPGMGRVTGAATVVGAALTVAEGHEAIERSGALYDMGNATGARSELIHFGTRSLGAWGGAALGAGAVAAGTSWSGPGAVIGGIVGGAAGLVGGQYVADYLDHRSIYRQQDAQGYTYAFDPENPALGWRRTETIDQIGANGQVVEQRREVVASGVLASQLDRQATTVSLDLMLARPPVPRDPYSLPAGPGDASSARETPWERDPGTGEWRRELYALQATPRGPVPAPAGFVTADPTRAEQLDAESEAIVRENVHLAPAAMAARYELAYHDRGWRQHGELPESARTALANDARLVASDGAEYQRQSDGRWERQAYFGLTTADANPRIAAELDATHSLLHEGLREHRAMMAERPQPASPTFEEAMTGAVARAYARQNLQPSAESIDAMGRAMAADYRARGLDGPFMLQLERDPATKQYGPDSPMGLYTRGADGDMALRFTMTPSEAREVLAAPTPTPPASTRADAAPRDPLNESMRDFVHAMDRSMGRTPDDASDRVAAALTAEWRANGLAARPDGVVLGQRGSSAQAGEYVFAYSGPAERPNDWVGVRTAEAVQTPVEQSLAKAETLQRQQSMEAQQGAQARQQDSTRALG